VRGDARISRKRASIALSPSSSPNIVASAAAPVCTGAAEKELLFALASHPRPPAAGTPSEPMKVPRWSPPVLGGEWNQSVMVFVLEAVVGTGSTIE
jgi:hypothetical protein